MRRLLLLTSAIVLVDTMFFAALTPLLPHYVDELGLGKAGAGVLQAMYPAGALVAGIPSGIAAARLGVKRTVLIGLSLLTLTTVAFGLADSVWALDLARFLQGVSSAFSWTGALAWLVAAAPAGRRGRLIGSAFGAAIVGALFGPVLGAVASFTGPGPAFGAVAGVALVLAAVAAATPAVVPTRAQPIQMLVDAISRDRRIQTGVWLCLLPALCFGTLSVLAPLRLSDLGWGAAAVGATYLVSAALEAAWAPVLGRISDRHGRMPPLLAALAGSARRGGSPAVAAAAPCCLRGARRLRGLRVRKLLDTRDVTGHRCSGDERARLRLRVRAREPRLGAGPGRRRGTGRSRRVGHERCGAVPRARRPVPADASRRYRVTGKRRHL